MISDVRWVRDQHGRPALELRLDGHPAHIRSSQRTDLTRLGIVDGMVLLDSDRSRQLPNRFVTGDYAPTYVGLDLVGCTDNPDIFTLYQAMCDAIRAGTWREGIQPRLG